jgi:SSS family solute:Na+ symporter
MSSLASVFNSCSTLYTIDIYKRKHPDAPEKQLVKIGQMATVLVVIAGVIWIPIMANISGVLYEYLQSVQAYIAPPITVVFLLGIFMPRINSNGAYATLVGGLGLGAIRIFLEVLAKNGTFAEGSFLHNFGTMNFLHFGVVSLVICIAIAIIVSMFSPAPSAQQLAGLTYSTISTEQKEENKNSFNWIDIVASILIVAIVAWVMLYFNGK